MVGGVGDDVVPVTVHHNRRGQIQTVGHRAAPGVQDARHAALDAVVISVRDDVVAPRVPEDAFWIVEFYGAIAAVIQIQPRSRTPYLATLRDSA